IVVLEVNGGTLLDHYDVRNIGQATLAHECGFGWGWKRFAGNRVDINDGVPGRNFALQCARRSHTRQYRNQEHGRKNIRFHKSPLDGWASCGKTSKRSP